MPQLAKEVRDCNTCLHHVQGGSIDDAPAKCWNCANTKSLILWEPMEAPKVPLKVLLQRRINSTPPAPPSLTAEQYARLHGSDGSTKVVSDGSTASYYELPEGSTELQDLIGHRNMNAQIGEIFRECYRYGQASHCDELRGIKKIIFYATAEKERLEKLNEH